jgi:hypothetical protein
MPASSLRSDPEVLKFWLAATRFEPRRRLWVVDAASVKRHALRRLPSGGRPLTKPRHASQGGRGMRGR